MRTIYASFTTIFLLAWSLAYCEIIECDLAILNRVMPNNEQTKEISQDAYDRAMTRESSMKINLQHQAINSALAANGYEYQFNVKLTMEIENETIKRYAYEGIIPRVNLGAEPSGQVPISYTTEVLYINDGVSAYKKTTDLDTGKTHIRKINLHKSISDNNSIPGNYISFCNGVPKRLEKAITQASPTNSSTTKFILPITDQDREEIELSDDLQNIEIYRKNGDETRSYQLYNYNNEIIPSKIPYKIFVSSKDADQTYEISNVHQGSAEVFNIMNNAPYSE
ncbi:MAG: hypothetical protein GC154_05660 [bacterium]|nr:hypothetical protein [bacterium]